MVIFVTESMTVETSVDRTLVVEGTVLRASHVSSPVTLTTPREGGSIDVFVSYVRKLETWSACVVRLRSHRCGRDSDHWPVSNWRRAASQQRVREFFWAEASSPHLSLKGVCMFVLLPSLPGMLL